MNLAIRSEAAELMDTACTDAADYAACLADLAQVNTLTLARRPTLAWLDTAMRRCAPGAAVSCSTWRSAMATCCARSAAGLGGAAGRSGWAASTSTRTPPPPPAPRRPA